MEVRGRIAGREWRQRVPLRLPAKEGGPAAIASLWARARIADLDRDLFAIDILSGYYGVLSLRDGLENDQANIERLKQTYALTRVLVEGGQRSRIEQDQAEQQAQIRESRSGNPPRSGSRGSRQP